MTVNYAPSLTHNADEPFTRSTQSLAFETFWRALRKAGRLLPAREDFSPGRAARFLPNLILMEAPEGEAKFLRLRVVGSAIDMRVGASLVGHNYFDFVPVDRHQLVVERISRVFEQPCGLWQVVPSQYETGVAQHAEVTTFPLAAGKDGVAMLLSLVSFPGRHLLPTNTPVKIMIVEASVQAEFIDVGNGVPSGPA